VPSVDYRPLFEDNPNPIIVFGGESRALLAVNDAACRHFGYPREELIGRDVSTLRPPEDTDRMRASYAASRANPSPEGPMPFAGLWRHQRKDGTIVHVEIWRIRIEYEGRPAVMALIHDVGARLAAEEALRSSEERYRLLFEAIPLPVLVFDVETHRYLAVNDAAVSHYGYSRDEWLSMTVFDVRPPEDIERLKVTLAQLGRQSTVVKGTWRHRKRDGTTFDVEIFTHAIDFAGRAARLAVARDLTERRRMEEQLRQSQKIEATGLLAGGVAHDFNNLLGVVIGASELARRAAAGGRAPDAYLDEIDGAANRAAELTRKLLAFSRKQVLHVRRLDLGEAVADFSRLLRRAMGEDVELVVRLAAEPLVVEADVSQLEQVILNLCTNARQAVSSGGRVTIETLRTRFDAADVACEPWTAPGDWAEVRVVDDGVGMDATTQARIFEPFFTTKPEGTGLGLAMVHGIVHQHQGLVHVESRPGHGTTVRVCLPRARGAPEPTAGAARGGSEARGGREVVLVAEDEAALGRLLESALKDLGYEVILAPDGEEAARAFESRRGAIALAILDVVMPRLGGVQAYERMRTLEPSLKVVFMTGHAPDHAQVGDVVARGGHALLAKPFALEDLGRLVRATLDGRA
jgi:PAS domain S-box-containing protein